MKHNIFRNIIRTVGTIAFAGVLAFGSVGTGWTGMGTVEAAKLYTKPTTLAKVTGIKYDAAQERIIWNKVTNASEYNVRITDANGWYKEMYSLDCYRTIDKLLGTWYRDTANNRQENEYRSEVADGKYTVTVSAKDTKGYYVLAKDMMWDWSNVSFRELMDKADTTESHEGTDGKWYYTFYKNPEGPEASAVITYIGKKPVTNAVTALPKVAKKEGRIDGILYSIPVKTVLKEKEYVVWESANNPQFLTDYKKGWECVETKGSNNTDKGKTFLAAYSKWQPETTIYVRARIYNPNFITTNDASRYSAYSKAVKFKTPKLELNSVSVSVTADSITLGGNLFGKATGWEFQKKVGSGWVKLATQTSRTYEDTGLFKDTKYQYRVRAYIYNKETKKTSYTQWETVKAMTWGANMNFRAVAAGTKSVKLTWKPVPGAESYEIYRGTDYIGSNVTIYDKGIAQNSFGGASQLIKTIHGNSIKAYTDKNVSKGEVYSYSIRAYKTVAGQKIYISSGASVELGESNFNWFYTYVDAKGNYIATWSKMTGIKGYYVEKYNDVTKEYKTVKKLKASATSYKVKKLAMGKDSAKYRIRPYSSKIVYEGKTFDVLPALPVVTGVKAVQKGDAIKITWKPVKGADYYKVYRTTDSAYTYNKTRKMYSYPGAKEVVYDGAVNTTNCHPELQGKPSDGYNYIGTYATTEIRGTTVYDTALTYMKRYYDEQGKTVVLGKTPDGKEIYQTEEAFYNGIAGPEPGKTYYYIVEAWFKPKDGSITGYSAIGTGNSKAASVTYTNKVAKKVSKITSIVSKKQGQVTIKYKKVKGVSGYAVFRSAKKNGTYVMVGTTTKPTYTDKTPQSGKTYYYKVASYVKGELKTNVYSTKTAPKKIRAK